MEDFIEKRKFPRYFKKVEMRYLFNGKYYEGFVQNLSLGGTLFRSKFGLIVGSPIQLIMVFRFGNHYRRCVLHGRIIRVKDDPYGFWPEFACTFTYSSGISLKILGNYLNHNEESLMIDLNKHKKAHLSESPRKKKLAPTWWTSPGERVSNIDKILEEDSGNIVGKLKKLFKKKKKK